MRCSRACIGTSSSRHQACRQAATARLQQTGCDGIVALILSAAERHNAATNRKIASQTTIVRNRSHAL